MNNETTSSLLNQIRQIEYESTVQLYTYICSLALVIYATLLRFSDEVEYIWGTKLTLPTCLYLLSRYPPFLYFSLVLVIDLLPETPTTLRICNDIGILAQIMATLSFLGIQGLISVRTYALCQGYRPMAIALLTLLLAASAVEFYEATLQNCAVTVISQTATRLNIVQSVMVILLETLTFLVVIRQVWGLWMLKRSLDFQSNEDLVTSILKQGILKFCFVLLFPTAFVFLSLFAPFVAGNFGPFQNAFSSLLICEFTLDLRRRNTRKPVPNQSAMDLPALSFRERPAQSIRSVLGRLHESIVDEMGERNHPTDIDGLNLNTGEPDNLQDNQERTS